jgi:hypothetical protein
MWILFITLRLGTLFSTKLLSTGFLVLEES